MNETRLRINNKNITMKFKRRILLQNRTGVALVEGSIVLSVVLVIILGLFDVGMCVSHHNTLSEGARRAARAVIVRGSQADDLGKLGPVTMNFTADTSNDIADSFRFLLATMNAQEVQVKVEWPENDNQVDQEIRVTLSYQHKTIVPIPFGYGAINLQAVSTMYIAH